MEQKKIIKTISPICIPNFLKVGINTNSFEYCRLLRLIVDIDGGICSFNSSAVGIEYQTLDGDNNDIRIFKWTDPSSDIPLEIHVFPNSVAIVEVTLILSAEVSASILESEAQSITESLIQQAYPRFIALLNKINRKISHAYWCYKIVEDTLLPKIYWISRSLLISSRELNENQHLIEQWLLDTKSPEEAHAIICGKRDYSMTWLNYVIVDIDECSENNKADHRVETMIFAQYYYTAQEGCNNNLKESIDVAYRNVKIKYAEEKLSTSRVATRLHYISYHDQLKHLTRYKRLLLIEILSAWEFESLVENGQRMIDVCSSRLEAVDIKRREKSTVMTDLLLVALSFFSVFELAVTLTEFSREMMSRPALDYHDDAESSILSMIANIDIDIMFSLGFGLTLVLIVIYRVMKR